MEQAALARVGARLRRVPGLSPLLNGRAAAAVRLRRLVFARGDARRLREMAASGDLRVNVGCGPGRVEGWANTDLVPARGVLFMDAASAWPLPDGCAAAVNSEHFVEHLTREQAATYFAEAHRVLRPGGVIRTSTPDLRGTVEAYLEGDDAKLGAHRGHGYAARTHADLVNNYFYVDGHRQIYDYETLEDVLSRAGFVEIERASFGESRHDVLRGVDTHDSGPLRDLVLAVDAVKPA
jgi:predicted SAM-dependent methyltransferase